MVNGGSDSELWGSATAQVTGSGTGGTFQGAGKVMKEAGVGSSTSAAKKGVKYGDS